MPHTPAAANAPERALVNVGFMALTDSASLIVAATQGFAQQAGITINLQRQPSWAALRDKLMSGELDAAQGLYGMVYAMHLGIGGAPAMPMAVMMALSQNGQAITLSKRLAAVGVTHADALRDYVASTAKPLVLAQTFPTGTHALWLNNYLAGAGMNPLTDVRCVVVPPAQMVARLQSGEIDGFCAGEPWGALAVASGAGFTLVTSQAMWPDHPEKVLTCRARFLAQYPQTSRALMRAILEASRFIDAQDDNRRDTAALLSGPDYLDLPKDIISPRLLGDYQDGLGQHWQDAHRLRFYGEASANQPWLSDGLWFLNQFRRWGLLDDTVDAQATTRQVQQLGLFREVMESLDCPANMQDNRTSLLADGSYWPPSPIFTGTQG